MLCCSTVTNEHLCIFVYFKLSSIDCVRDTNKILYCLLYTQKRRRGRNRNLHGSQNKTKISLHVKYVRNNTSPKIGYKQR